jgi:hypothetical protein
MSFARGKGEKEWNRVMRCSTYLPEVLHQLADEVAAVMAVSKGLLDAAAHVVLDDLEPDATEGAGYGGDLAEDLDAIPVLGDHAAEAADLALDAVEALGQRPAVRARDGGMRVHRPDLG